MDPSTSHPHDDPFRQPRDASIALIAEDHDRGFLAGVITWGAT
jgi:hypothetical protein